VSGYKAIVLVFFVLFFSPTFSDAFDTAPRMTDREIVERLTRLEAGQQAILRELDKRFEAMEKTLDKRFEALDKRFETIDTQFTRMTQMFVALFLGTIGFALWDRRTMIRPFETKIKAIDKEIGKIQGQQEG